MVMSFEEIIRFFLYIVSVVCLYSQLHDYGLVNLVSQVMYIQFIYLDIISGSNEIKSLLFI